MAYEIEFAEFWQRFPRKVAKLDAKKAYEKARRVASAAEILDGVERYLVGKPSYADWCYPASWLNKGRWMDEYDVPKPVTDWWAECKAIHGGSCEARYAHGLRMQLEAMK